MFSTQHTDHHEVIELLCKITGQQFSPISSENLMQSRLGELGLQSMHGGAGDCFFVTPVKCS